MHSKLGEFRVCVISEILWLEETQVETVIMWIKALQYRNILLSQFYYMVVVAKNTDDHLVQFCKPNVNI
jgi:hypothetical protein